MKYQISSSKAPKMPTLGKGTECIKLLASQISPDMREAIVPMFFPALAAYVSNTEFQFSSLEWQELSGLVSHLIADSGMGKGQLTVGVEAIMRKLRQHDDDEMQKLSEWIKTVKSKSANQPKPTRPDCAFFFPPADISNPAYIQNSMACEKSGNHTQFFSMPEVEMLDQMCGGHRKVSKVLRLIYDCARDGALRATPDGVSGNPRHRVTMDIQSTPIAARKFFKNELFNGTFGRVTVSYKAREGRIGKIPRRGNYDEAFLEQLDEYIIRLEACKGRFIVPQLNKLADKLAAEMATIADLADDDVLWDMSKRSIGSAWKSGCLLYILNGQMWTRNMAELVEWLVYHDLWSKMQVFGDMLKGGDTSTREAGKTGPKNMLDSLDDSFSETQLEALRISADKPKEGTKNQLRVWMSRGFIDYSEETKLYTKTQTYKKRIS